MKTMRWVLLVAVIAFGLSAATVRAAETLDNNAVIEMQKLGLGEPVILEKIKSSPGKFETGVDDLKKLKAAGVSDAVIKAMISASTAAKPATTAAAVVMGDPNDPKAMHPSGIYLAQEAGGKLTLTKLDPNTFGGMTTGGGWGIGWGGSAKTRAVLEGLHAHLQIGETRPVFYFYFDAVAGGLSSSDKAATNPEDFTLTQLELRESKAERRLVVGKAGMGGARFGIDKKAIRPMQYEKVAESIYKVWPTQALVAGEYSFVYGTASGMGGPSKVFDFGVK